MSKPLKNYYELARKISEYDYYYNDNDLVLFSKDKYCKKERQICPTDETYHDYYYNYLGITKKLTLHDDIVNKAEAYQMGDRPFFKRKISTFGLPKNKDNLAINELNQPIFNSKFLTEISKKGYLTIYSNKK